MTSDQPAAGEPPAKPVLTRRTAGILLHPTSLPGPWANGDLGREARHFVDFLADAGQCVWQILPLGPTHEDGSPYQSLSVHAGNPGLIDLAALVDEGWLPAGELTGGDQERHAALLRRAYREYLKHADPASREALAEFLHTHAHWLDDYALYQSLRQEHDKRPWMDWPVALRDRHPVALEQARARLAHDIGQVRFEQFLFFRQWEGLKRYANGRGVQVFGDLPIFIAHDSADVWAHREYFELDEEGRASRVAGVPPDYFSETGQRWGNPHYRWDRLQADGFRWWLERMRTQLHLFDLVRIDHFRGFQAYWEIPGEAETAIEGRWVEAPGEALFDLLHQDFDPLPLVAEDLGVITDEVLALRDRYRLPGMTVLQFAFDSGAENPYLPHNHMVNSVVYTGTHDNDTTLGWFQSLDEQQQARVRDYLALPGEDMPWPLLRCAWASVARLAIVPMQDVLRLDSEHRMNRPGTLDGNWRWRFTWETVPDGIAARLRHLNALYGRCEE